MELTRLARLDQLLSIDLRCRPVEAVPESLTGQSLGGHMVRTCASVYLFQECAPFFLGTQRSFPPFARLR